MRTRLPPHLSHPRVNLMRNTSSHHLDRTRPPLPALSGTNPLHRARLPNIPPWSTAFHSLFRRLPLQRLPLHLPHDPPAEYPPRPPRLVPHPSCGLHPVAPSNHRPPSERPILHTYRMNTTSVPSTSSWLVLTCLNGTSALPHRPHRVSRL